MFYFSEPHTLYAFILTINYYLLRKVTLLYQSVTAFSTACKYLTDLPHLRSTTFKVSGPAFESYIGVSLSDYKLHLNSV